MRNNISVEERNKIVVANMGLVKIVVRQYYIHSYLREDLEQEGYLGLIDAAERFDETRGIQFASYASVYIRRYVENAIHQYGGVVTLPRKAELPENSMTVRDAETMLEDLADTEYGESARGKRDEQLRLVDGLIRKLTVREQVVIRYAYGLGVKKQPYTWIADHLDVTEVVVRKVISRGLKKISKKM